jgi:dihydrofolate reductase
MTTKLTIEGYVIASGDGMLTDASGAMPDSLKFDADYQFFSSSLDRVDLIVHGRKSFEDQPNSANRRRVIVTRSIDALAPDKDNPRATLWNPAGASLNDACAAAGLTAGTIAIIGGPDIFAMFFDRYDVFWLSQAPHVQLPGGRGCFTGVPAQTPQQLLAEHGLSPDTPRLLDAAHDVTVTPWRRG